MSKRNLITLVAIVAIVGGLIAACAAPAPAPVVVAAAARAEAAIRTNKRVVGASVTSSRT